MPGRALLAAVTLACLLASTGCAVFTGQRGASGDAAEILEALFPAREAETSLVGEGDVALSLAGRRVSLPGIVLLGLPGDFRLDLLDPFDRPLAVIFASDGRLVQYRPQYSEAAGIMPFPSACRHLDPAAWVPYALGEGPPPGRRELFRPVAGLGTRALELYRSGSRQERIDYRGGQGAWKPEKVTWYCGDEPALRLLFDDSGFAVLYLQARFRIEVEMTGASFGPGPGEDLLHPVLPRSVRWKEWELVEGR